MDFNESVSRLRARDRRRQSMPGEHALTAALGGALVVAAVFAPSPLRATLRALLGGALLLRAASGRDGLAGMSGTPVTSAQQPWLFPTSAGRAAPGD